MSPDTWCLTLAIGSPRRTRLFLSHVHSVQQLGPKRTAESAQLVTPDPGDSARSWIGIRQPGGAPEVPRFKV
jgi:hypothetical protein